MLNFTYYNPTRIVFGKGTIAELEKLVPRDNKVLMLFGGGSIRRNGVYDQVRRALAAHDLLELGGIEPNPHYETCLKAVATVRTERVGFLLAVGGGSVIDAAKFVAAAAVYTGGEPWDLVRNWSLVRAALPLGVVLTLPGTGSEMNGGAVISRQATREKLYFISEHTFPRFSILDPETTYSLPPRQMANGTIDAFVQVLEQYLTYDVDAPLQDRFAESLLLTILAEAPKVLADPRNYAARANLMWCATNGLNGAIGCGVPQDWASHAIGHELTVLYGVDHGQSLALVMPLVMRHQRHRKRGKLLQYARRIWGLSDRDEDGDRSSDLPGNESSWSDRVAAKVEAYYRGSVCIDQAIAKTEAFFRSLGASTRMADCGIPPDAAAAVAARLARRNLLFGEHQDIGSKEVEEIMGLGAGS